MITSQWSLWATSPILKRIEQFHVPELLRPLESGTRLTSKPVREEEPTWTKLLSTYAGKSSAKMQTKGDKFPKIQELAEPQDEEAAGETGTGDNDIGQNVLFFEIRYPHDERPVAFVPAGSGFSICIDRPFRTTKHHICSIEALEGPYIRQLIIPIQYAGLQCPRRSRPGNVGH